MPLEPVPLIVGMVTSFVAGMLAPSGSCCAICSTSTLYPLRDLSPGGRRDRDRLGSGPAVEVTRQRPCTYVMQLALQPAGPQSPDPADAMEVMKQLRQRAIRDLLEQRPIRTQQELAAALRERGFRTTQATISRDVAELGLIKVTREGTQAYALPPRLIEAETSGEDRLRKLLPRPARRDPRSGPAARPAHAAGFGACHRRRARPRPLARGRRVRRRRRHALRGVPGSRVVAADPAAAPAPDRGVGRGRCGGLRGGRATASRSRRRRLAVAARRRLRGSRSRLARGTAGFDSVQRPGLAYPRLNFGPRMARPPGVLSYSTATFRTGRSVRERRGGPTATQAERDHVNTRPSYLSREGLERLREELEG